jgi:hypothetical protein
MVGDRWQTNLELAPSLCGDLFLSISLKSRPKKKVDGRSAKDQSADALPLSTIQRSRTRRFRHIAAGDGRSAEGSTALQIGLNANLKRRSFIGGSDARIIMRFVRKHRHANLRQAQHEVREHIEIDTPRQVWFYQSV